MIQSHWRCTCLGAFICTLLASAWLAGPAQAQTDGDPPEGVKVERVADKGILKIRVPARNGKVAWEDVLRALLQVARLDDDALADKFPSGTLDLERPYSRYTLMGVNVLLAPNVRMEIVAKTADQPAHLLMTVNEDAIQQQRRRMSQEIRDRVTGGERRPGRFGLRLQDGPGQSDPTQPLVIVVHGFNSSPERFEPLAAALREAGLASATYSYPDDQSIEESAAQLSADLKEFAKTNPQRKVFLVTHSMGGLVSRAAVEQPELDPGNVAKLIMLAPPTHGSLLAQFAFGIDAIDQFSDQAMSEDVTAFYASVEDGLSEARTDLQPNSPFLRKLDALARNPRVQYSIFLGTGGHLSQQRVDGLREGLKTAAESSTTVRLLVPRYDPILADLDEVVTGKGDGVVAVKRGRLDGVADVVLADFTHLNVLQASDSMQDDKVFQSVLKRLRD